MAPFTCAPLVPSSDQRFSPPPYDPTNHTRSTGPLETGTHTQPEQPLVFAERCEFVCVYSRFPSGALHRCVRGAIIHFDESFRCIGASGSISLNMPGPCRCRCFDLWSCRSSVPPQSLRAPNALRFHTQRSREENRKFKLEPKPMITPG